MMKTKIIFLIILLISMIDVVSANTIIQQPKAYLDYNGTWRNYTTENLTQHPLYSITNNTDSYTIGRLGTTINLPKRSWITYDFQEDRIKPIVTIQNYAQINSLVTKVNASAWYVTVPWSASKVLSASDNFIDMGEFKRTLSIDVRDSASNTYNLIPKIVGNNIRLYFNPQEYQNVVYPLTLTENTVTIDATTYTTPDYNKESPTMVWINDTTGYKFYRDSVTTDGNRYSKTNDSGVTWGTPVQVTGNTGLIISVWYDRWTPGDTTGNLIHIAYGESSSDDFFYRSLDTANADTLGAATVVNNTLSHVSGNVGGETLSITKSSSGVLFYTWGVDTSDTTGYNAVLKCAGTCTTSSNWVATTTNPNNVRMNDPISLMPLGRNGDVMYIMDNLTNDDILSKVYYSANDSWDSAWTTIDANAADNTTYTWTFMPTVDQTDGDIYLTYGADIGLATADIRTAFYDNSTRTWTAKTDVLTDSNTITSLDVIYDQPSDTIYTTYLRGTAGSNTGLYWKNSTDGMTTWGSEVGPINDSISGNLMHVRANIMTNGTIRRGYATFLQNTATNDGIFGVDVFNVTTSAATTYLPPDPVSLTNTTGNFWVRHDWQPGSGNVSDSYNVSQNGTWFNGSSNTFNSTIPVNGWSNITIWAYNNSNGGMLSANSISMNTQLLNPSYMPPVPTSVSSTTGNFWVNHTFTPGSGNKTDSYNITTNGTTTNGYTNTYFNATTTPHGWINQTIYAWNNSNASAIYNSSEVHEGIFTYDSSDSETFVVVTSITLSQTIVGAMQLKTVTHGPTSSVTFTYELRKNGTEVIDTWTQDYNNGAYTTRYSSYNNASLVPGSTIGVYQKTSTRYNGQQHTREIYLMYSYGSKSLTALTMNTQVPNNIPTISIGNKSVLEGAWLNFSGAGSDLDSDTLTYGTNASKGTFNTTTGYFNWSTTFSDSGVYTWYFNASDGYGGIANETITVTITNVPEYIPPNPEYNLAYQNLTEYVYNNYFETFWGEASRIVATESYNGQYKFDWDILQSGGDFSKIYLNGAAIGTDKEGAMGVYQSLSETINVNVAPGDVLAVYAYTTAGDPVKVKNFKTYKLENSIGNFYVNHTWVAGSGNVTDSYNITQNGTWFNGSSNNYINASVGAHGWSNITVWSYNSSADGKLSSSSISINTQVPNNVPLLGAIGNKSVNEGQLLTIILSATDADSDALTNGTNASKGSLVSDTYTWTPDYTDSGIYIWYFNTSDAYGGVDSETIYVTVNDVPLAYIPSSPISLANTTGNFWVNHTWQPASGNVTDSYNISHNNTWTNGTTLNYFNASVGAHGWSNISVYAYNNSASGTLNSTPVSMNTQVPNNIPILSPIGNKSVNEGSTLTFTVSATDIDFDTILYATNASGSFNTSTGLLSWNPNYSESGIYTWYFTASDLNGGVDSEIITVTISNTPLTITPLPASDPSSLSQAFIASVDRSANLTWYMNETLIQTNTSVISGTYTNSTATAGNVYNVTVIANDPYDNASFTWNWTVSAAPTPTPTPTTPSGGGGGTVVQSFNPPSLRITIVDNEPPTLAAKIAITNEGNYAWEYIYTYQIEKLEGTGFKIIDSKTASKRIAKNETVEDIITFNGTSGLYKFSVSVDYYGQNTEKYTSKASVLINTKDVTDTKVIDSLTDKIINTINGYISDSDRKFPDRSALWVLAILILILAFIAVFKRNSLYTRRKSKFLNFEKFDKVKL